MPHPFPLPREGAFIYEDFAAEQLTLELPGV